MTVLQFVLRRRCGQPAPPDHQLSVAYTGTHDTDTGGRLVEVADPREQERASRDRRNRAELAAPRARARLAARDLAVIPVQDVLGLGNEARWTGGHAEQGNWSCRLEAGQLSAALARRLRPATERSGRCVQQGELAGPGRQSWPCALGSTPSPAGRGDVRGLRGSIASVGWRF